MALDIYITNEVTGESHIYEHEDHVGKRIAVPTYRLVVQNDAGYRTDFDVTRDTLRGIRGEVGELYGFGDECPPNSPGMPYEGYILEYGKNGFRLGIAETALKDAFGDHYVQGIGPCMRRYIQIHIGPGSSEGCFLLVGGVEGRNLFEKTMRDMIKKAREKKMFVHIDNRYD